MEIKNMIETGLGHRTIVVETLEGTESISATTLDFLIVKELQNIKQLLEER